MANLYNLDNKFLVTTGGNVLIGQTGTIGSSIFQVTGNSTFAGNITGVGASFIGAAASGAALVTIENNSGSTATSYGLLVIGGGNSSNGRTFEVRDASGNSDLIVKGNGNVGIAAATPTAKLQINSTTNSAGPSVAAFLYPLMAAISLYCSIFVNPIFVIPNSSP